MVVRTLMTAAMAAVFAWAAAAEAPALTGMDLVLKSVPDGPVARVGSEWVSAEEFRDLYGAELGRRRAQRGEVTDVDRMETAMQSLRLLVERAILLQEARKRGITVSDGSVADAWAREVERLGRALGENPDTPLSEAEVLQRAGVGKAQALEELRRTMMIEEMRQQLMEDQGVSVTDEEVAAFFEENRGMFQRPDLVHLQQIFLRRPQGAGIGANGADRGREQAETALARLRSGESFAGVARDMSEGPYADQGGDTGRPVPLQQLPPELHDPIVALTPGEVSGVLESPFGYHIIKMVEYVAARDAVQDEVEKVIRERLAAGKANQAVRAFAAEASASPQYIRVYLDFDKQLQGRPDLVEVLDWLMTETEERLGGEAG
jgi:parvulin-like peptidyl-prolyl isomerase